MLTTVDNPYDPFDDFDAWLGYDQQAGHHSLPLLARIAVSSDDMSDADQSLAIKQAIDEIIEMNPNGLYRVAIKAT